jgi:hypothetical protein
MQQGVLNKLKVSIEFLKNILTNILKEKSEYFAKIDELVPVGL